MKRLVLDDEFTLGEILTMLDDEMNLKILVRSRPTGCLIRVLYYEMKYGLTVVANIILYTVSLTINLA